MHQEQKDGEKDGGWGRGREETKAGDTFTVHLHTFVKEIEPIISGVPPAKVSRGQLSPGRERKHHNIWKIMLKQEAYSFMQCLYLSHTCCSVHKKAQFNKEQQQVHDRESTPQTQEGFVKVNSSSLTQSPDSRSFKNLFPSGLGKIKKLEET